MNVSLHQLNTSASPVVPHRCIVGIRNLEGASMLASLAQLVAGVVVIPFVALAFAVAYCCEKIFGNKAAVWLQDVIVLVESIKIGAQDVMFHKKRVVFKNEMQSLREFLSNKRIVGNDMDEGIAARRAWLAELRQSLSLFEKGSLNHWEQMRDGFLRQIINFGRRNEFFLERLDGQAMSSSCRKI